jgi:hypothetical protein
MRRRCGEPRRSGVRRLGVLSSAGSCQRILLLDCNVRFWDRADDRVKRAGRRVLS